MKNFSCFLFLFFISAGVHATEDCKKAIPSGALLFDETDLGVEFACLYELPKKNDNAVLDFYTKGNAGAELVSSNDKLISLEEARSSVNIPSITRLEGNQFQILWDYPNGRDLVELTLKSKKLYFKSASKEMRLQVSNGNEAASFLVLESSRLKLNNSDFSRLSGSDIFDKDMLTFNGSNITIAVGAEKAFLYSEATDLSITKGYLVKGDLVKVMGYKSGFLRVKYKKKDGAYLDRWISLSSVI
ncbi:hypothetical protein [Pseudomonas viridiflava]|uniref:hypothetical protein n=1 Tax=Pseudomonas viridiflava TaxID=33069 RepID=UPI000F018A01|nr:hypothetical protein [Pseudomonas viridiflava]VVM47211.1 hypothetical protein PS634_00616 [Pseudomonas fluorescens]